MARTVGYARVSTKGQTTDMQKEALRKAGCEDIYPEQASGKNRTDRPVLERVLKSLQKDDTFVVYRLDRAARSVVDLNNIAQDLKERGIQFKSLTEDLDTTTSQGQFLFNVLAAVGGMT